MDGLYLVRGEAIVASASLARKNGYWIGRLDVSSSVSVDVSLDQSIRESCLLTILACIQMKSGLN